VFNKFFSENFVVYEIMWKNIVRQDRPEITYSLPNSPEERCSLQVSSYPVERLFTTLSNSVLKSLVIHCNMKYFVFPFLSVVMLNSYTAVTFKMIFLS
jgi:hypothetical protein